MAETSTETLDSTEPISIPDKYFVFKSKNFVLIPVLSVLICLLLIFGIIVFLNYSANEKFMQNYRYAIIYDIANRLKNVDDTALLKNIIDESLKNRWVKTIFICDRAGNLIIHSIEEITQKLAGKRIGNKYEFIFNHLWQFKPDGTPIPLEKVFIPELSVVSALPVYDAETKTIKYVVTVKFHRFMFDSFLLRYKKLPWYFFFIEIGAAVIIIILLVSFIIFILLKNNFKKINRKLRYILLNLYKINPENLPLKVEFNAEKFKDNIVADYIKFINDLLDKFYNKLQNEIKRGEGLRRVVPPLILREPVEKEIKVLLKSEQINIPDELWNVYFKNEDIKEIEGYSTGLYHFKKKNPDIVFKFINISSNKKGFFIAEIKEGNTQKKSFLLSFINYFLNNRLENIDSASTYLANMNNLLNRVGHSELKFDALYTVLDNNTNYIEVSSTRITPLIFYKAEDREATYYEFAGLQIGERWGDEFVQSLKKESFRLSNNDTLVILNKTIENLVNFDGDKYELHNIVKTIHKEFPASAEVMIEKIKDSMKDFSVDFSKIDDLIILIIKRNQ